MFFPTHRSLLTAHIFSPLVTHHFLSVLSELSELSVELPGLGFGEFSILQKERRCEEVWKMSAYTLESPVDNRVIAPNGATGE